MNYITSHAIIDSIARKEIVELEHDEDVARELAAECTDSVAKDDVIEFWAVDDDGNDDWRVHLYTGPRNANRRD